MNNAPNFDSRPPKPRRSISPRWPRAWWSPSSANGWHGLVPPRPGVGRPVAVTVRTTQVPQVNHAEQPWQKRAKKLAARKHREPNERRLAREQRRSVTTLVERGA